MTSSGNRKLNDGKTEINGTLMRLARKESLEESDSGLDCRKIAPPRGAGGRQIK